MANEIVWYDSSETGAPVMNNAAGSLDAVLNACLVTGFRTQTLTGISVTAGVATATLAGHGYGDQRMVDISGATPAGLNGRKLITATGSGTFTFDATAVAAGAATGTITAKRSPLGWARPLSIGNVSIYERTDVTATAMKLRVDDSGAGAAAATYARGRMIETYTDLSTFTNPAPPAASLGGNGVYLHKGTNSASAKKWVLVGDSRTFYMFTEADSYQSVNYFGLPQGIYAFGDAERLASADVYACLIAGAEATSGVTNIDFGGTRPIGSIGASSGCWWPRATNHVGGPVVAGITAENDNQRLGSSGPTYPSPLDQGLVLRQPVLLGAVNAAFGNPLRGVARGLANPLAAFNTGALAASVHLLVFDNLLGSSRTFLMVGYQQQGLYGVAAFDITGPWA